MFLEGPAETGVKLPETDFPEVDTFFFVPRHFESALGFGQTCSLLTFVTSPLFNPI
jgi:hypothetical protein